ncbi:hypothetical protein TPHA_0N00480 [Tetrapisispora phaffii CBS 4417]|uniref:Uncharacterized protein n=1 Tax=Tetrapisispora phaffii (strain ATCC 24235 / CBS 4417 / NBRC 1672 / NRRL Y-8282 / UCD 70-5) TaxID=1071381 RepID=G8C100_TETPH|nr:hypothetical protein TPHA_0N00480 [Tetrapisispora phaffii CBS 4417]CCE65828.1 hypothetical protein TPHA_0N00480 [Tetrapisispora phaffii CBS 4417]
MFAKAAASASAGQKFKEAITFDAYDSKIIQYQFALNKLSKAEKVLNDLEKNLKVNPQQLIIPLVNYILPLFEGPIFNINPRLRKRYMLLSEGKQCKTQEIPLVRSSASISYEVVFPDICDVAESFKENMYNYDQQQKALQALKLIIANAIQFYNSKLSLTKAERARKKVSTTLRKVNTLDLRPVDDLINPQEISLCLDFAVLIKDRENDTSLETFHKLQSQVLTKFILCIKDKLFVPLKKYYKALLTFSSNRNPIADPQNQLPYWEQSIHRIYAFLFRILNIQYMLVSMTRQLYIPNREYLNNKLTLLQSENVHDFETLLLKIQDICTLAGELFIDALIRSLEYYSESSSTFQVQQSVVIESFQINVSKSYLKLKDNIEILLEFSKMCQYIQNHESIIPNLKNLDDEKLTKMLDERRAVDKLASVEQKQKIEREKQKIKQEILAKTTTTGRRTISKRTSTYIPTSNSSRGTPASVMSPNLRSPIVSPQISRTNSRSNSSSRMESPNLSRGSVGEQRNNSTASRLKIALDKSNKPTSRKRSSSLQSAFTKAEPQKGMSPLPSRSNSLQVGSKVNQKVVQESATHLVRRVNTIKNSNSYDNPKASHSKLKPVPNHIELKKKPLQSHKTANKKVDNTVATLIEEEDMPLNNLEKKIPTSERTITNNKNLKVNGTLPNKNIHDETLKDDSVNKKIDKEEEDIEATDEIGEITHQLKKVRFTGVPPMPATENSKPKKQGWYKKPEVLHYPPPAVRMMHGKRYIRNQEGLAFKTSLREMNTDELARFEVETPKESTRSRITSKLFDKLR